MISLTSGQLAKKPSTICAKTRLLKVPTTNVPVRKKRLQTFTTIKKDQVSRKGEEDNPAATETPTGMDG